MTKLGAAVLGFAVGVVFTSVGLDKAIDGGDVVHVQDDMYVKASTNKSGGYSFAKVFYKPTNN